MKPEVFLPLSQGKVAVIDFDDFEKVRGMKWHAVSRRGRVFYAVRNKTESGKRRQQSLHQEIFGVAPTGFEWGHKDGDGLNCRRANIQCLTHKQNTQGRRNKKQGASSQYRGVSWNGASRRWRTRLDTSGKRFHLGLFDSEIEAAKAYDKKARELFGKYAAPNFESGVSNA